MTPSPKKGPYGTLPRRALALSLGLHLATALVEPGGPPPPRGSAPGRAGPSRIRVVRRPPPAAAAEDGGRRQVVETERTGNAPPPGMETRFLGERDQAADRQTAARRVGVFKEAGRGRKDGSDGAAPGAAEARRRARKSISLADLSPAREARRAPASAAPRGSEGGREGVVGEASGNDHIDDVPLGDMTRLNTVKFKYYGFYYRIKKRLEQHWGSEIRKEARRLVRGGGRRRGRRQAVTSLAVMIDRKGNIVDIVIKSPSGVKVFDDAAVRSFNKAGPFPNPPSGILRDGVARVEWGFVVKG